MSGRAGHLATTAYGIARQIGLDHQANFDITFTQLLDLAVAEYWQRRPRLGPRCGSRYGYYDHRNRHQDPCPACRRARARNIAIERRRRRATALALAVAL